MPAAAHWRRAIPSESVENYLKAIYELEEEGGRVNTSSLAERLAVSPPSVSAMLKRLSQETPPLVDHEPHRGVTLTPDGLRKALVTVRHHRLIETFLCQALGYTWDEVHEEAEQLEHHISERLEDRIAEFLGHPSYDPHGAPIPTKDGHIPDHAYVSLAELEEGQRGRVLRVKHDLPDVLRYLTSLGIEPEVEVVMTEKAPFDGPVYIRVGKNADAQTHGIGRNIADMVMVKRELPRPPKP